MLISICFSFSVRLVVLWIWLINRVLHLFLHRFSPCFWRLVPFRFIRQARHNANRGIALRHKLSALHGRTFRNGRRFAAWLGPVPRQHSSEDTTTAGDDLVLAIRICVCCRSTVVGRWRFTISRGVRPSASRCPTRDIYSAWPCRTVSVRS